MRAVRPPPCLLRIGSSLQSGTAPAGELRCKCKVNERFSPLLEYVLDDDVDRYLPFRVRNPAWPDVAITWRMLLTHTWSLNEEDDERVGRTDVLGKDPRDTLADVMTQHFCARSASWWPQHSDGSPAPSVSIAIMAIRLPGFALQRVVGEPLDRYVHLTASRLGVGYADFAQLMSMLVNKGTLSGKRALAPASVRLMLCSRPEKARCGIF